MIRSFPTTSNRKPIAFIKNGLGLFLLLMVYDGALRKWVLPSFEQLLFIAKDALILCLLVYGIFNGIRKRKSLMHPVPRIFFMLYAFWVLLEFGNLNLPNLLVGIWGVKSHLLYASLVFLLPLAFDNLDHILQWLVKIYPWLVMPVCGLAFIQLASPADSFINQQVTGGMEMISYFGESNLVRVTGTFSYITGLSSFVQATAVLGLGLFLCGASSRSFFIGLGFALATLPAAGSRSVIAVTVASVIIMFFAATGARLIGTRKAVNTGIVIAILAAISLQVQNAAWTALQQRIDVVADSNDDTFRAVTAFTNAFDFFDTAGLLGFGSGSTNLGAPALASGITPFSWLPSGVYFEEESGRLVLELGILGWLFSLIMRFALFLWAAKLALYGFTRSARIAAIIALPAIALGVHLGNGVFSPPFGATYYWFCVALLAMAEFEHRQSLTNYSVIHMKKFEVHAR